LPDTSSSAHCSSIDRTTSHGADSRRYEVDVPTLRQLLAERSNDYSDLETRYRVATGAELVLRPWESFERGPSALTLSASVLIGAYNSAATLRLTLASLTASTFNRKYRDRFEVIVVDDGSTDETRDVVCGTARDLRVVYVRQQNAGLTRAHNTGLAFASGDVVVFSDADMVHLPYAVEELMKRHEVLEHVTLVGFRFELAADDPRLAIDRLAETVPALRPAFYGDFRLSFPGRPDNMCLGTRHLKDLGHGRTLAMPNGAHYNLPAMAVGAFMSLRRSDYLAMGGSDERLVGWGCEDSTIGARSIGLGNFIVPVYSAASGHVSHPRRTATEGREFAANTVMATRILDEPFERRDAPLTEFRARAVEVIECAPSGRPPRTPPRRRRYPVVPRTAPDHAEWGLSHYTLGDAEAALANYCAAARLAPDVTWHHLGCAKALRELGRTSESFDAFGKALRADPSNSWAHFEVGLTHASCADYDAARAAVERARALGPDEFDFRWTLDTTSEQHKTRGNHHARQGLHRLAVRDLELALVVDRWNSWAEFDRATSLRALGRHREALDGLRRTDATLHPADGNRTWVHAALGRACIDLGFVTEAKIQLERSLELWAANPAAAADLVALHEAEARRHGLQCHLPIVEAARDIEGWLSDAEADLLIAAVRRIAERVPSGTTAAVVEIGSYCGKSTVVLASTLKAIGRPELRFYAIDPHQGYHFGRYQDTFDILIDNLRRAGILEHVTVIRARSTDVQSPSSIGLLFIDGLHDYENVRADFAHFAAHVLPDGFVAFHDYFEGCPDVKRGVNDLLREGQCEFVTQRDRLVICRLGDVATARST
jgi:GT2 family glycosyltransferase/tetratricopeptide (TPR) repeat protein